MKNGLRHGKGKNTFADGTTYEGTFKNNLQHGYGKSISERGDVYIG